MSDKIKPSVYVQLGDDGNPEVKAAGSAAEQSALCVALMAGLTMMYSANDPAEYLTFLMMSAAELLEHLEETNHED